MTPLKLTLQNFLSYRDATLDFTGFHTACICGVNGAGKSSLLEAVTWAIWGESRTAAADDVIHSGETDVRVDFEFENNQQIYKIIRMRSRGKAAALQFQVRSDAGEFKALSTKGIKDTQNYIVRELKLDYDTFINSAYLRQGRADEFMLAKPAKRKEILGNLLKLEQYEILAQQAKERAKEFKIQGDALEQSLEPKQIQLDTRPSVEAELENANQAIAQLKTQQEKTRTNLKELQKIANQRQAWEQQLSLQQQDLQRRQDELARLGQDLGRSQAELANNQALLDQTETINQQFEHWQALQKAEDAFAEKFRQYQELQQQYQQAEQQLQQQEGTLQISIRRTQARLEDLAQRQIEEEKIIAEAPKIEKALVSLEKARIELNRLDSLQHQVSPLLQRRFTLENQIVQASEKLKVRLESLSNDRENLSQQIAQIPEQREKLQHLDAQLVTLDKKKTYQDRVRNKRLEQAQLKERLQASQQNCHQQLEELQQKLSLLQTPDATCPLCDQDLDHDHREHVIQKTQDRQTATEAEIWRLKEQLLRCDQDLGKFESELGELKLELDNYAACEQQFFKIEAELERNNNIQKTLQSLEIEIDQLGRSLNLEAYAEDLRAELGEVKTQLETLRYDERSHAIAREDEKKWRWAEIRKSKIDDATHRLEKIQRQQPELQWQLQQTEQELAQLRDHSPLQTQLEQIAANITALDYNSEQHQALTQQIRTAQVWQLRHQELQQAIARHPQLETRLQELQQAQQSCQKDFEQIETQMQTTREAIAQFADHGSEIEQLEAQIQHRRQELDHLLAHQGQLQQSLQQLQTLADEYEDSKLELTEIRRQHRIYKELGSAFGKNGIQTLLIENALPQLEAETNQILSRLTGNQFHVQFLTQKARKGNRKKITSKMIDTLDIVIADARGTRSYETYSGGEAFRINFSIRLALAKLLAQRSGMALQMLVIDEGFGTQDAEGCARLIAAINAIADDFACILAVTHIPQFKEAFQSRIEVYKSKQGSQIRISN
ncbi:exonuclease SbcC [[Leptolyngbya] sp. PCC 7376]|uniref:exonuclease subunit SbcC n=1 Tax=[Leptolyngbya] sp. PCC 7376 TaxID=111781 RepID=UPI00029F4B51|nr:exonuclease subunit SbcC [[Leptolyngbya] sp. PCC 7376]AFY37765.1 exonuclease SbcC [[Leptolyngbya] sp. PCC 7376]